MTGFRIDRGTGFKITFENGWSISVQFGPCTYCEKYDESFGVDTPDHWVSKNAEVAIFNPRGHFTKYLGDEVQGYQDPREVLRAMWLAARQKPSATEIKMPRTFWFRKWSWV